jgi:hypothetical protein
MKETIVDVLFANSTLVRDITTSLESLDMHCRFSYDSKLDEAKLEIINENEANKNYPERITFSGLTAGSLRMISKFLSKSKLERELDDRQDFNEFRSQLSRAVPATGGRMRGYGGGAVSETGYPHHRSIRPDPVAPIEIDGHQQIRHIDLIYASKHLGFDGEKLYGILRSEKDQWREVFDCLRDRNVNLKNIYKLDDKSLETVFTAVNIAIDRLKDDTTFSVDGRNVQWSLERLSNQNAALDDRFDALLDIIENMDIDTNVTDVQEDDVPVVIVEMQGPVTEQVQPVTEPAPMVEETPQADSTPVEGADNPKDSIDRGTLSERISEYLITEALDTLSLSWSRYEKWSDEPYHRKEMILGIIGAASIVGFDKQCEDRLDKLVAMVALALAISYNLSRFDKDRGEFANRIEYILSENLSDTVRFETLLANTIEAYKAIVDKVLEGASKVEREAWRVADDKDLVAFDEEVRREKAFYINHMSENAIKACTREQPGIEFNPNMEYYILSTKMLANGSSGGFARTILEFERKVHSTKLKDRIIDVEGLRNYVKTRKTAKVYVFG